MCSVKREVQGNIAHSAH